MGQVFPNFYDVFGQEKGTYGDPVPLLGHFLYVGPVTNVSMLLHHLVTMNWIRLENGWMECVRALKIAPL